MLSRVYMTVCNAGSTPHHPHFIFLKLKHRVFNTWAQYWISRGQASNLQPLKSRTGDMPLYHTYYMQWLYIYNLIWMPVKKKMVNKKKQKDTGVVTRRQIFVTTRVKANRNLSSRTTSTSKCWNRLTLLFNISNILQDLSILRVSSRAGTFTAVQYVVKKTHSKVWYIGPYLAKYLYTTILYHVTTHICSSSRGWWILANGPVLKLWCVQLQFDVQVALNAFFLKKKHLSGSSWPSLL
jgi:hypothetical protein